MSNEANKTTSINTATNIVAMTNTAANSITVKAAQSTVRKSTITDKFRLTKISCKYPSLADGYINDCFQTFLNY